jgi:hypothetical protein
LHKVSSAKYNSSIAGDILAPNSACKPIKNCFDILSIAIADIVADFSPVKAPSVASTAPKRSQTSEQEKEPLTTASTDINESKTPQQASITNTAASTGTIDGRQFFRQAKSVLSYDEFTNLLWNVKAYNNRDQSRSQTLENVHASIGKKYPELHMEFQSLLANR